MPKSARQIVACKRTFKHTPYNFVRQWEISVNIVNICLPFTYHYALEIIIKLILIYKGTLFIKVIFGCKKVIAVYLYKLGLHSV